MEIVSKVLNFFRGLPGHYLVHLVAPMLMLIKQFGSNPHDTPFFFTAKNLKMFKSGGDLFTIADSIFNGTLLTPPMARAPPRLCFGAVH